ncbi:DUF5067 domain-containing protein [Blautia sp.]|uniref:DUF5067 domain-containing protein n=1 Tax=Blautia sp. TaxID=1955243 RepID=UPI00280AF02C|nr:DUF5067 domain-containing protein [Blautia sp.]MED9882634.1 DUF5067 domain-containing protein [Blautia sp.]
MDTENLKKSEESSRTSETVIPDDPEHKTPIKKKRKKTGLIIFLTVLILAAAGGVGYYFMERQKPINTVKTFLGDIQKLNFDGMKSQLQSNDMSALDNADITNNAYTAFFQNVNQKMTFEIKKTSFSLTNGTANITAKIRYIDGSDIYKETITEFLKQIVSTAFSGEELTEEQTQQKLAALLEEKAGTIEDKFAETEITYPLIKTGDGWKIVALDTETVKFMSANFTNVQDEINQSLVEMETSDSQQEQTEQTADSAGTIDMSNDKFSIHYKQHRVAKDVSGAPCLLVYYDYSNNGSSASSAMVDVNLQAYQNGQTLTAAIPESDDSAIDQFMAEVQPGQAVTVCQAFALIDETDVTLEAGEAFSFGGGTITSQIIKIK